MMAGAGGAMRATGWRATAIRFQQFGEGVPGNNIIAKLAQKFVDGQYLREVQIEIRGNMPTGQNERMEGHHGMSISNCKYEFSACHEGRWINRTKWACRRN